MPTCNSRNINLWVTEFLPCSVMFPHSLVFSCQWQHGVHKNHIYLPVILAANGIFLEKADYLFYDILIGVFPFEFELVCSTKIDLYEKEWVAICIPQFWLYMYGYKNKAKSFPWTDLVKGYHCNQIVAHYTFLKSGHGTQWMFTYHKFGSSEMVFFISYWIIFGKSLAWSLARVTFFFTVTFSLFITQDLTHCISWEIKEDCSGQLFPYWASKS